MRIASRHDPFVEVLRYHDRACTCGEQLYWDTSKHWKIRYPALDRRRKRELYDLLGSDVAQLKRKKGL